MTAATIELRQPAPAAMRFARVPFLGAVETAGIEPASAVAQEMASTSVAGVLISLSTSHAGRVVESQLQNISSRRLERTDSSKPAS